MAGRGTDIMLGGNPEFLAKREMRKMGISDELISKATGSAVTYDPEILQAKETFRTLFEKYKKEIAPEAEAVRQAGGLYILGTERHESRRIDNQLRGRSGRQGDPGESKFFLSLQDDLMRLFGAGERLYNFVSKLGLDETTPISAKILSSSIESAQKRIEANNFSRRRNVLTYDDVMNQQRNVIYSQRHEVLTSDDIKEKIINMIRSSVESTFDFCFAGDDPEEYKFDEFKNHYMGLVRDSKNFEYTKDELLKLDKRAGREELVEAALSLHKSREELFKNAEGFPENAFREVEKVILLQNVDKKWMDHLEAMDALKEYVGLNSYAQRDPVAVYRIESADIFDQMIDDIKEDTVRQILSVVPRTESTKRVEVAKPTDEGFLDGRSRASNKPASSNKVGRNDPCPCGSGKKYKKCCGRTDAAE